MPCRSDWPDDRPNQFQRENHLVAVYLTLILPKLGKVIPGYVMEGSINVFCNEKRMVPLLCKTLGGLTDSELEKLLYGNPKDRSMRDIATWWEDHQEMDKRRIAEEKRLLAAKKLREKALAKLSLEEKKALGLKD